MRKLTGLAALLFCLGCQKFEDFRTSDPASQKEGYYIKTFLNENEIKIITIKAPQPVQQAGSMFTTKDYLFVAEHLRGIHVYDNRIPATPVPLLFISLPAVKDFFVKDKILVSDNGDGLVSLDIRALDQVAANPSALNTIIQGQDAFRILKRTDNIFAFTNYPSERNIYFQCPDSVGFVVEWEKKAGTSTLNCYR